MSELGGIINHFMEVKQLRINYSILNKNIYNIDEKGFCQGISDRAKVICKRRDRGMSAKVAMDGNKELITIIEYVSTDGVVIPPLIIYNIPRRISLVPGGHLASSPITLALS